LRGLQVRDYGEYKPAAGDISVHLAQTRAITEDGNDANESVEDAVALGHKILAHDWGGVLYISSEAVYGGGESYARPPSETLAPEGPYARMKMACEQKFIAKGSAMARLSNAYGPGMADNNVLSDILAALNDDGPLVVRSDITVRDFIWVEDIGEGIAALRNGISRINP